MSTLPLVNLLTGEFRMRYLTIEELVLLNQYVQGLVTKDNINDWFGTFEENEKQIIVKDLWMLAIQARVLETDLHPAAKKAGLKMTHVPIVMLSKGDVPFRNRGYRLSELKGTVLTQAFLLVLECFTLAEQRRKQKEGGISCHHWWHKDLSDALIVKEILENYK